MATKARVSRLERTFGSLITCPVCRGKGLQVNSAIIEGEPVPEVEGCPHCGKVNHIVICFSNPTGEKFPPGEGQRILDLYA